MKQKVTKIANRISLFLILSFSLLQFVLLPTSDLYVKSNSNELLIYVLGLIIIVVLFVGLLHILQLLFVLKWRLTVSYAIRIEYRDCNDALVSNNIINNQNTYRKNCVIRC